MAKPPKGKRLWSMPQLPKSYEAHENVNRVVNALVSPDTDLSSYIPANATDYDERQKVARLIIEAHLRASAWRTSNIVSSGPQYARSALGAIKHLAELSRDAEFRTALLLARDCIVMMHSADEFSQGAFEEITQMHLAIQSNVWAKLLEPLVNLAAEADRKAKRSRGGKPQTAYRRMFIRFFIVEYANRVGHLPPKGAKEDAKTRRAQGASFHDFVRAALFDVGIDLDPQVVTKAIRDEINRMLRERDDKSPSKTAPMP